MVSAGFPHDGYICLLDWRNKLLVAKVKSSSVSSPISSIAFSKDRNFIVAAVKNQLKFWRVRWSLASLSNSSTSLYLQRKVDLGPKELSFVAATSISRKSSKFVRLQDAAQIPFYAVTNKGKNTTYSQVYIV